MPINTYITGLLMELQVRSIIESMAAHHVSPFPGADAPVSLRKNFTGLYSKLNYEFDITLADKSGNRLYICECKNCSNRITLRHLQLFILRINDVGAAGGCFISSSPLTHNAIRAAYDNNITIAHWNNRTNRLSWTSRRQMLDALNAKYVRRAATTLKKAAIIILMALLSACSKKIYVPVENTIHRTDTLTEYVRLENNNYALDSVVIETRGDTVLKNAWRVRIRDRIITDTVYNLRHDTITTERLINPGDVAASSQNHWKNCIPWLATAILLIALILALIHRKK